MLLPSAPLLPSSLSLLPSFSPSLPSFLSHCTLPWHFQWPSASGRALHPSCLASAPLPIARLPDCNCPIIRFPNCPIAYKRRSPVANCRTVPYCAAVLGSTRQGSKCHLNTGLSLRQESCRDERANIGFGMLLGDVAGRGNRVVQRQFVD